MTMTRMNGALVFVAGILLQSCAATQPTLDTSADAELSHDGLSPVKDAVVDKLWVRPDFDLRGYTKLLLNPVGIQYRPVKSVSRVSSSRSTEFPVTDSQKVRLIEIINEEFGKTLSNLERYEIVDEPGSDVLVLRGAIIDVVSRIPPDRPGRTEYYLSSVGEATLVIELLDSQSGAPLVRVVDRRAANQTGYTYRSSTPMNTSQIRQVAGYWARLLAKRLEHVSDVYSMGEQ